MTTFIDQSQPEIKKPDSVEERDAAFEPRIWHDGSREPDSSYPFLALFRESKLIHSSEARQKASKHGFDYWKHRPSTGNLTKYVKLPVTSIDLMQSSEGNAEPSHEANTETMTEWAEFDWRFNVQSDPPSLSLEKGYYPREYVNAVSSSEPSRFVGKVIAPCGGL